MVAHSLIYSGLKVLLTLDRLFIRVQDYRRKTWLGITFRLETVKTVFDSQGQDQHYVYCIYRIVWLDAINALATYLTALTIDDVDS